MCMTDPHNLPYFSEFHNAYFFYDEIGDPMGPYPSYKKALKEQERYAHWLNHGPTLWQLLWWPIRYGVLEWLVNLKNGASNLR